MSKVNRRQWMAGAGAVCAAMAAENSAQAQLVYREGDWKYPEFQELLRKPARVRQVFDATAINDGRFLNGMKNSLNGLEFGYGIAAKQVQIVAALHGPANMVNYDDTVWSKYRIGEWLNVKDPQTGRPATRNIFQRSKISQPSQKDDPSDLNGSYQDHSVEGLQRRGVKFLSCHTATEEQTRALIDHWKLNEEQEAVVKDIQSHVLPGVLIVPSMVATLALLQIEGHYVYTAA